MSLNASWRVFVLYSSWWGHYLAGACFCVEQYSPYYCVFCVLYFSLNTLCILYCFTELINSQAQLAHVCVIALITGLSYQNTHSRQICCCQLAPRQIRTQRQIQIQRQKQRYHGPLLPKRTLSSDLLPTGTTLQIGIPLHSIAFLQHLRFCHIVAKASSVLYVIKEGLKKVENVHDFLH